jgi:preprotein translocase subunit YajC
MSAAAFSPVRSLRWLLACTLFLAVSPGAVQAQDTATLAVSDTIWEVRLTDGTLLVGRVVAATEERVTIETAAGTRVDVARAQIRSLRLAEGRVVDGAYWFADPNHTRLFLLSPTGRSLERGEGYISAFMVVLPFVAYGVTDYLTIAGGTPLIPEVIGRVFYLAPKVRVLDTPRFDASAGVLAFFLTEDVDAGSVGLLYGVGTYGSLDHAVTAGAGWAFELGGGESDIARQPVVMLGGETRVARTVKLVTENFFVPGESGALLSAAVRLFGERISVDVGLMGFVSSDDFGWIPAGNFVYNFGRRR